MRLQDLSPELLLCVLCQVDNADDFIALISASPDCLRAYKTCPKQTIKSVLTNSMHPESLHHALALADFMSSKSPPPADDSADGADSGSMKKANASNNAAIDDPKWGVFPFPDNTAALEEMLRMYRRVWFFIRDFAAQAVKTMEDPIRDPDALGAIYLRPQATEEEWPAMSMTENIRFERAFYRYKLYYQINPPSSLRDPWDPSLRLDLKKYKLFHDRFRLWEVEEIMTVEHYLRGVVVRSIRAWNSQVVDNVLAAPGNRLPPGYASRLADDVHFRYTCSTSLEYLESLDDESVLRCIVRDLLVQSPMTMSVHCSSESYREQWAGHLASHGLAFTMRVFCAKECGPKAMTQVFKTDLIRDISTEVRYFMKGRISSGVNFPQADHQDLPTEGFFKYGYLARNYDGAECQPLREIAFSIWDSKRAKLPWVKHAVSKAAMVFGQERRKRAELRWGVSAARRLSGVKLPGAECEKIRAKYYP